MEMLMNVKEVFMVVIAMPRATTRKALTSARAKLDLWETDETAAKNLGITGEMGGTGSILKRVGILSKSFVT